jgi:hypothetical protein
MSTEPTPIEKVSALVDELDCHQFLSKDEVIEQLQDQLCSMKKALELAQKFKETSIDGKEDWDRNIEESEDAILHLKSVLHHLGAEDDNRPFNPILA